jgi:hypothetical protein
MKRVGGGTSGKEASIPESPRSEDHAEKDEGEKPVGGETSEKEGSIPESPKPQEEVETLDIEAPFRESAKPEGQAPEPEIEQAPEPGEEAQTPQTEAPFQESPQPLEQALEPERGEAPEHREEAKDSEGETPPFQKEQKKSKREKPVDEFSGPADDLFEGLLVPEEETHRPRFESGDGPGFSFNWGSYSSSFTTDFSGYDSCSMSLSPVRSSEEEWHGLHVREEGGAFTDRAKVTFSVTGKLLAAKNLIMADRGPSYVTIQLVSKGRKKGETLQTQAVNDGVYSYDFNLGIAKKGHFVQFTVVQEAREGERQIGFALKAIKDLPTENRAPMAVALTKPSLFHPRFGQFLEWGSLAVVLNLQVIE